MASLAPVIPCSRQRTNFPSPVQPSYRFTRHTEFEEWSTGEVKRSPGLVRRWSYPKFGLKSGGNARAAASVSVNGRGKIEELFQELKKRRKVALIPYLTAGDPNLETTAKAVKLLDALGADIIELGVPYSDPLADGPVIQAAASRSLLAGTNLDNVLLLMHEIGPHVKAPIVVFVYYNQLLKRGQEKFVEQIKAAGVAGLLVPDLPLEQTNQLRELTSENGLELILLTTPTTPAARMKAITSATQGFIYLVSLTGVTGARDSVESRVQGLLESITKSTSKPVAVGFGVSTPQHAEQIADWGADGVIIGSAVVRLLGESGSPEEGLQAVEKFFCEVSDALSKKQLLLR